MDTLFTLNEVRIFFEYAVQHQEIDAVGLSLKVAQITNSNTYTFLSDALEKSDKYYRVLAKCLTQFGQYDQLDLIFKLLQNNSTKVKFAAILSLQMLSDPRALEPLKKQIAKSDSEDDRERATNAYKTIVEKPVALQDNTVYTFRVLTPLDEADLALADFLLNRDLSDREIAVLVKRLFHPNVALKKQVEKVLLQRGEKISESVLNTVVTLNLPLTQELINIFSNYKDDRAAHLIIQCLKSNNENSDLRYKAIGILGTIGGEEAAFYLAELIVQQSCHSAAYALKKTGKIPVSYILSEYKNNRSFRHTGALDMVTILGANALQVLLEAIQDSYREVREDAKSGLTELGVPSVEPLIELLNLSSDMDVQLLICPILGEIADNRALAALEKSAQSKNKYLHQAALEAICKIKDPLSVQLLSKWIESPDRDTRKLVVNGLWNQHYAAAVVLLIKRVYDIDKEVRLAVIANLGYLANEYENVQSSITDTLLMLLNDEEEEVADLVKTRLINLSINHQIITDKIDSVRKKSNNGRLLTLSLLSD
jgi:HEAT repeat protein